MRTLLPWAREFNSRCVSRVLGPLKGLDCKGGLVGPGALYLDSWAFELHIDLDTIWAQARRPFDSLSLPALPGCEVVRSSPFCCRERSPYVFRCWLGHPSPLWEVVFFPCTSLMLVRAALLHLER